MINAGNLKVKQWLNYCNIFHNGIFGCLGANLGGILHNGKGG